MTKYKFISIHIIYLLASCISIFYITSDYIFLIINFVINLILLFINYKILKNIDETYKFTIQSCTFREDFFIKLNETKDIEQSFNYTNTNNNFLFNLDYNETKTNPDNLLKLKQDENSSIFKNIILDNNIEYDINNLINIEKNRIDTIKKNNHIKQINSILFESLLLQLGIMLIRLFLGKNIFNYEEIGFKCIFLLINVLPMILITLFINIKWRNTYEIWF